MDPCSDLHVLAPANCDSCGPFGNYESVVNSVAVTGGSTVFVILSSYWGTTSGRVQFSFAAPCAVPWVPSHVETTVSGSTSFAYCTNGSGLASYGAADYLSWGTPCGSYGDATGMEYVTRVDVPAGFTQMYVESTGACDWAGVTSIFVVASDPACNPSLVASGCDDCNWEARTSLSVTPGQPYFVFSEPYSGASPECGTMTISLW